MGGVSLPSFGLGGVAVSVGLLMGKLHHCSLLILALVLLHPVCSFWVHRGNSRTCFLCLRVQTQRKQVACSLATSADTRQELTILPYGGAHSESVFRQVEPGYQ